MYSKTLVISSLFVCIACNNSSYSNQPANSPTASISKHAESENPYATIKEIPMPAGFTRLSSNDLSFSNWLRQIRLKKDKIVYTFNGLPKRNQSAQFAVLDITVGNTDLQQCADAVMRLRAEYLFATNNYDAISFRDNEGKVYSFNPPYNRNNFSNYLNRVFGMCGSASLSKQLKSKTFDSITAGDVLIRGGFPGHAVIVMDVAINKEGKKIYLLAQSYMPAQDIHVLVNPMNRNLSPWYEADAGDVIETPEYIFSSRELKGW
ncbi:MAG: DUF4846 domain-containing protein [Ferruginibacter sp.]